MMAKVCCRLVVLLVVLWAGVATAAGPRTAPKSSGKMVDKLPVFSEGTWKVMYAVYEQPTFNAVLDEKGVLSIQPLDNGKEVGTAFQFGEK